MKPRILLSMAILAAACVALFFKRNSTLDHPAQPAPMPAPQTANVPAASPIVAAPTEEPVMAAAGDALRAPQNGGSNQPEMKKSGKKPGKPKEPIQDPEARVALSFVGADPDAEAYWISAINDPGLSGQERQDLIEDLNEDGLADPHQGTPQDLPLILARIRLIEELAPYAMDQVNADAFAEAHKDLVNLAMGGRAQ